MFLIYKQMLCHKNYLLIINWLSCLKMPLHDFFRPKILHRALGRVLN